MANVISHEARGITPRFHLDLQHWPCRLFQGGWFLQRWAPGYPGFMNKYETASCFKPRMEILKSLKEAILEEFSFPMVFMKVGFTEWIDFERDVPEYHLDVCGTGRCLNQTCYTECPLLKYTGPNRIEKLPGVRRSNVVYCHCR